MKQVIKAVQYLHTNKIIHRDIKGANILISGEGVVKLADFGLARVIHPGYVMNYTIKVVTLWYRAPEILLGYKNYDDKVDIWSVGCFFFELFFNQVMFKGQNEKEQIMKIFETCGTPDPEQFENYNMVRRICLL